MKLKVSNICVRMIYRSVSSYLILGCAILFQMVNWKVSCWEME